MIPDAVETNGKFSVGVVEHERSAALTPLNQIVRLQLFERLAYRARANAEFASQFVLVWQCNAGLPIAACDALQHGAEDLQV
jgi:hypothetical protein